VISRAESRDSLVEFLTEFATYLLAAGVSISQFHEAAQIGFLRAAAREARFGNAKVNQSAVAAVTGLSRYQVRALLRAPPNAPTRHTSRAQQLVRGWLTDPAFNTSAGNARVLQRRGRGSTFAALAKKFGGDVPPRALLAELLRQGYVKVKGNHIALSAIARRTKEPATLSYLSVALAKLIGRTAGFAGAGPVKILSAHASYETPVSGGRILLQRRMLQGLKAFAADVEAAGSAASRASKKQDAPSRGMSRTSILLVSRE
jgi:hypothetical protein